MNFGSDMNTRYLSAKPASPCAWIAVACSPSLMAVLSDRDTDSKSNFRLVKLYELVVKNMVDVNDKAINVRIE